MPALCKSALFTVPGRQVACVSGREGVKRETDTITIKELSLLLPGKSGSLAGGGGGGSADAHRAAGTVQSDQGRANVVKQQ